MPSSSMSTRERLRAILSGKPVDRLPMVEWAMWWDKTIGRWKTEGLPQNLNDRYEINRYFGQDVWKQFWIGSRRASCPQPKSHGQGIISNMDDYQNLRQHLYPDLDKDFLVNLRSVAAEQQRNEIGVWVTVEGFFWFARTLLGVENHLYAFYDQPELLHAINTDLEQWQQRIFQQFQTVLTPDFMTFAEDMSYNLGPMLSPDQYQAVMDPYYKRIIPRLRSDGIVPIVDSDGDVTLALPWFLSSGMAGLLPLERQAGVDVAALRAANPQAVLIGAFDKMTMPQGEAAMRAEFERLLPTAKQGRFIISCDHQTPPGVSLENYSIYMRLFEEYARKA
jgi:uroporphyrinogen-III decarboxylase